MIYKEGPATFSERLSHSIFSHLMIPQHGIGDLFFFLISLALCSILKVPLSINFQLGSLLVTKENKLAHQQTQRILKIHFNKQKN